MPFNVSFAKVTKKRTSVSIPPVSGSTIPCLLKDDCSIVHPIFSVHVKHAGMSSADELFTYNYCFCNEFYRFYWITNIVQITNYIFEIHCECDVLATWYEDIISTNAFCLYSASHSNSMIPDGRLPRSDVSHMNTIITDMDLCPDEEGVFIVAAASSDGNGTLGPAQLYALNRGEISALVQRLYSPDFIEKIADAVLNPSEALISCTWLPISMSYAMEGSGPITFNTVFLAQGNYAKKTYSNRFIVTPYLHYHTEHYDNNGNLITNWADYRNCEPYSMYHLWLPGVGLVQIPMISLIGTGETAPQFAVEYDIAIPTGQVTYYIHRMTDTEVQSGELGSCVMTVTGNIGVQLPIASHQSGTLNSINSLLAVGSAAATVAIAPNALPWMVGTMVQGTSNTVMSAMQSSTHPSGSVGGFASNQKALNTCACITTYYDISDEPSAAASTLALPLFAHKRIGSLHGLCFLQNANVETGVRAAVSATFEEHQMLDSLLNGGGVYIE